MHVDRPALYDELLWEHSMATWGYERVWDREDPAKPSPHSEVTNRLRSKLWPAVASEVSAWFYSHLEVGPGDGGLHQMVTLPFMVGGRDSVTATLVAWFLGIPHASALSRNGRMVRGFTQANAADSLGKALVINAGLCKALDKMVQQAQQRHEDNPLKYKAPTKSLIAQRLEKMMHTRDPKTRRRFHQLVNEFRQETYVRDDEKHYTSRVGSIGLDILLKALPEYVEMVTEKEPDGRTFSVFTQTAKYWTVWNKLRDRAAMAAPALMPMIAEPKPWVRSQPAEEITQGGYHAIYKPMIRNTPAYAQGGFHISDQSLKALNTAQAVPFRVNQRVYETVSGAMEAGNSLNGLIPERPKSGSSPEAVGVYGEFERTLGSITKSAARAAIWFPKSFDWRGRMYDMPHDFHTQGSDLARAAVEFYRGTERTAEGVQWRAVNIANYGDVGGVSKKSYEERIGWVEANADLIERCAKDPLNNLEWTTMDKPWLFLAACFDWTFNGGLSHFPVALDGSCSGMQHYSLLTRDPIGSAATNCIPLDAPNDLYKEVASRVYTKLRADAAANNEMGLLWYPVFTDAAKGRKVVKRATMTTPYGVTGPGITKFMLKDGHVQPLLPKKDENKRDDAIDKKRFEAAAYMTKLIQASLGETMSRAAGMQAHFNSVAYELAKIGKPLRWRTPAGSIMMQSYRKPVIKKVLTGRGSVSLMSSDRDAAMDIRRSRSATSPNIIHALDGAHLQLSVCAMADAGITDCALVHDSFGTHAELAGDMQQILLDTAWMIYKDNQAELWQDSVQELAGVVLPPQPALGDLDPGQVLGAAYMFA